MLVYLRASISVFVSSSAPGWGILSGCVLSWVGIMSAPGKEWDGNGEQEERLESGEIERSLG